MSHTGRCFRDRRRTANRKRIQAERRHLWSLQQQAVHIEGMTPQRIVRMSKRGLERALRVGKHKFVVTPMDGVAVAVAAMAALWPHGRPE